jgi:hypothetical protein
MPITEWRWMHGLRMHTMVWFIFLSVHITQHLQCLLVFCVHTQGQAVCILFTSAPIHAQTVHVSTLCAVCVQEHGARTYLDLCATEHNNLVNSLVRGQAGRAIACLVSYACLPACLSISLSICQYVCLSIWPTHLAAAS